MLVSLLLLATLLFIVVPAQSAGLERSPGAESTFAPLPAPKLSIESSVAATVPSVDEPPDAPTVTVTLYNVNARESATFTLPLDGQVDDETALALEQFFKCRRTGRHQPMAPGVLAMLADLALAYPDHVIEVLSGYRSPPYGAPNSKHFKGHAIDLRVRGVKTRAIRDYLWRTHREIGVGFYQEQNFVHVDHRPGEKDVAWTSESEQDEYHYNPRWARRARQGLDLI